MVVDLTFAHTQVFGHGVTLHIYSPPIYKCNVYCPCTGSIDVRRPGFYTIYKKLLDADVTIYKKVYDSLEAKEKSTQRSLLFTRS